MRGEGWGELQGLSQWVQLFTGAKINLADLSPYLIYKVVPSRNWYTKSSSFYELNQPKMCRRHTVLRATERMQDCIGIIKGVRTLTESEVYYKGTPLHPPPPPPPIVIKSKRGLWVQNGVESNHLSILLSSSSFVKSLRAAGAQVHLRPPPSPLPPLLCSLILLCVPW